MMRRGLSWGWERVRTRPFWSLWVAMLVTPGLLGVAILTWGGLVRPTADAAWDLVRPATVVERCEAELAEYRAYLERAQPVYAATWQGNAHTWDGKFVEECLLRR